MYSKDAEVEGHYPPEGAFEQVDGWDMHYVSQGQGRDVILLHGAGGSTRDMSFRIMPHLARMAPDLRLTAVDRPGHGWTRGLNEEMVVSPLEQAALLWRFCDMRGITAPIILGQSYGGAVALAMATLRPTAPDGLCLVSAASSTHIPTAAQGVEMLMRLKTIRQATLATISSPRFIEMSMQKLFNPEPVPNGYVEHLGPKMALRERLFRHQMLQVSTLGKTLSRIIPQYGNISMPVEILHGTMDDVLDHDRHGLWLSGQIKGSRFTSLPGVGHMPHHTRVEDVTNSVIRIASAG